jgi:hypothetical protein
MHRLAVLCTLALVAGCAPAVVVTASAALPSAAAVAPHEDPERDPQARGLGRELSSADVPDDRDGNGVTDSFEACADPPADRVFACRR